ncbi:MAG: hypothetical protein EON59_00625 [Alphaproteobacteria bacterium]|nr:MAG: hypothetical protein EON59_00625 [Alphaproteobacteria bacterium]
MADTTGIDAAQGNRPTRAQTERTQRRRRNGTANTAALDVTDDIKAKLAAEGKEGRWINDIGNRMHDKTVNDDWDKVSGVEPRVVGMDKRTGEQIKAYFCAKPTEFLEEDRKARLTKISEQEQAIVRGTDGQTAVEGSYQPKSVNRIGNTT